jgi:hypothetical protein
MTGMVILNIGMNLLLSSSMGPLWNLINALQMIMLTQCVNVRFPANAMTVFELVNTVTKVEILPDEIIEYSYVWNYFGEEESSKPEARRLKIKVSGKNVEKVTDADIIGLGAAGYN